MQGGDERYRAAVAFVIDGRCEQIAVAAELGKYGIGLQKQQKSDERDGTNACHRPMDHGFWNVMVLF